MNYKELVLKVKPEAVQRGRGVGEFQEFEIGDQEGGWLRPLGQWKASTEAAWKSAFESLTPAEQAEARRMAGMIDFTSFSELAKFCEWLEKHGYLDSDWWCEEPSAVTRYLEEKNLKKTLPPP